jgi:hypothetical protein
VANFIKLTNNSDAHKGNPIYINADHITAIFDAAVEGGNIKTFIFGGHTGVQWEVEQSPKQIVDMIAPVEYVK